MSNKDKNINQKTQDAKQVKEQVKQQFSNLGKEQLIELLADSVNQYTKAKEESKALKEENLSIKQTAHRLQTRNKNLKEKNAKLANLLGEKLTQKSTKVKHKASNSNVSHTNKVFQNAKDRVNKFFNKALEKGKNKVEEFRLNRQRDYHSRFQKTRALLKSINDLAVKPTTKFTKRQFNNTKKSVDLIHNKVSIELNKQGLDKRSMGNYTAMFVAVSTKESGKKLYQVTGAKKAVTAAVNLEAGKKLKNAYTNATNSVQKMKGSISNTYNSNLEKNKEKAKSVEAEIKAKKSKQQSLSK